ncbi:MAG: transcription termination/antitermination protein NusG [Chloroflexota bacterium]
MTRWAGSIGDDSPANPGTALAEPGASGESLIPWYALRSKPRKELFAASQLERAGIEVFVPLLNIYQQHGKRAGHEPLFPGYLFGRLDPLRTIQLARYTPGVLSILGYGDEAWPVPDNLVLAIQQRLARGRGRAVLDEFQHGDRVTVTSGPLAGLDAVFDCQLSATGRVRVLIQIMRRVCRTELLASQLRRLH